MIKAILGLLLVAGVTLAGDVDFSQCPSRQLTSITKFGISGCEDGASTCTLIKGDTYDFDISAFAHFGAPTMTALYYRVATTILGIELTLLEGNACQNMTTPFECPINPGENTMWHREARISDINPAVENVPVTLRLWANNQGTNEQAISCATFRLNMRNPADHE